MNRILRRKHRQIWLVLAIVLLASAVAARRRYLHEHGATASVGHDEAAQRLAPREGDMP